MNVVTYKMADQPPMIAADETGRLLTYLTVELAQVTADHLNRYGLTAAVAHLTAEDAQALCEFNGVDDGHDTYWRVHRRSDARQLAADLVQRLAGHLANSTLPVTTTSAYVWTCGRRVVCDDTGNLIATQSEAIANAFAVRLRERGANVNITRAGRGQISSLLASNEKDETAFTLVEAQTTGPDDALSWARSLADRIPLTEQDEAA